MVIGSLLGGKDWMHPAIAPMFPYRIIERGVHGGCA